MTSLCVYAGPSLTTMDRRKFNSVTFLPPIEEGDLLKPAMRHVSAVGIIDGYFGDRRAVSHKEILWLMSHGVTVYGAASMGALRAAELDSFGMIGIGDIYADYRAGILSDDGDVAISHGPEEIGFPATSIALVDVAATVQSLLKRDRIAAHEAEAAFAAAAAIDFRIRDWPAIGAALDGTGFDARTWTRMLDSSHVERKRLNALELLHAMCNPVPRRRTDSAVAAPPLSHSFRADLHRAGVSA